MTTPWASAAEGRSCGRCARSCCSRCSAASRCGIATSTTSRSSTCSTLPSLAVRQQTSQWSLMFLSLSWQITVCPEPVLADHSLSRACLGRSQFVPSLSWHLLVPHYYRTTLKQKRSCFLSCFLCRELRLQPGRSIRASRRQRAS
jgi:hypothetical protein